MKIRVKNAVYTNNENESFQATVILLDDAKNITKVFPAYHCVAGDTSPVNIALLEWAEKNSGKIKPYTEPPPYEPPEEIDSKYLKPDGTEMTDEEKLEVDKRQVINKIDEQLAVLASPRFIARGQIDKDFEEKRLQSIKEWLDVENQKGFPYGIDYPEIWSK